MKTTRISISRYMICFESLTKKRTCATALLNLTRVRTPEIVHGEVDRGSKCVDPAHDHVIRGTKKGRGKKSEVLIYLSDEQARPSLRENRGMRKVDVKRALGIAFRRQGELLEMWRQISGN